MQGGRLSANSAKQVHALQSRLLARIHRRGYKTITETHTVGPLQLPFTRVAEPDAVLDRIVEEEDRREKVTGQRRDGNDLHLPYWAELWDSALGLGEVVRNQLLRLPLGSVANVLDVGCGMGFTGMVAAAMGAHVVFADLEADTLLFAKLNSARWNDRVHLRRLNWQTDRLDEQFDLILGADVLYDKTQWEFLEPFFRAHLKNDGQVLLGEPGRQTGDMFPSWIEQRGWTLHQLDQAVPTRTKPVRIFQLRRRDWACK